MSRLLKLSQAAIALAALLLPPPVLAQMTGAPAPGYKQPPGTPAPA